MATAVIMPRQGQSVESCIITKWHVAEGDSVKTGDLLFTYETDKATFDEEAKTDGVLLKILREENDDVPVLENVCVIGQKGDDISQFLGTDSGTEANTDVVKTSASAAESAAANADNSMQDTALKGAGAESAPVSEGGDFIKISPRAKNLAQKLNIDYSQAAPTGAEGRIIQRDIDALAASGVISLRQAEPAAATDAPVAVSSAAPATAYVDEKISNTRKVISKAMLNSVQTTAQLTHTASFDASEIFAYRKKLKPLADKGDINNITLNDMVMFAVARVLKRHRIFNAHMLGDTMRYFSSVNLAMAVDTPRGLLVPVCFNAGSLSLNQLAASLKKLASDAQGGTISPDVLTGGSFTVSNLGVFGTESFTPILNAPQTGILGVNTIVTRVRESASGSIETYPSMALSLTYDHRAVDGAAAAKFLQDVCKTLENFTVTLASD